VTKRASFEKPREIVMVDRPRAAPPNVAEVLNTFRADMEGMFERLEPFLDAERMAALRQEYARSVQKLERLVVDLYNPPASEAQ
jgi:hypothetical protein